MENLICQDYKFKKQNDQVKQQFPFWNYFEQNLFEF